MLETFTAEEREAMSVVSHALAEQEGITPASAVAKILARPAVLEHLTMQDSDSIQILRNRINAMKAERLGIVAPPEVKPLNELAQALVVPDEITETDEETRE